MNSSFQVLLLREFVCQVMISCIVASHSATVGFRKLRNGFDNLEPRSFIEHQEQGKNHDMYYNSKQLDFDGV